MTEFKNNTAEGLDLRIDIRTNRSKINDDLNKHISSLLNLHSDLQKFEKDLTKHLENNQ